MINFDIKDIIVAIQLILSLILTGLFGGIGLIIHWSIYDVHRSQFVDCVVFGFFIINTVHAITVFGFQKQLPKPTRLLFSGLGFIFWLTTAALTLEYSVYFVRQMYDRFVSAGVFSLVQCIVSLVDLYFTYKNTE